MGVFLKKKPADTLTGERLEKVALSALYSTKYGAFTDCFETGLGRRGKRNLLEFIWGVYDEASAKAVLKRLLNLASVSATLNEENADEKWREYIGIKNKRKYTENDILPSWDEITEELIEYSIVIGLHELNSSTAIGWDVSRLVLLARICAENNYVDEETAWRYINKAEKLVRGKFSDWDGFAKSYLIGRTIWEESGESVPRFRETYKKMTSGNGILNRVKIK